MSVNDQLDRKLRMGLVGISEDRAYGSYKEMIAG